MKQTRTKRRNQSETEDDVSAETEQNQSQAPNAGEWPVIRMTPSAPNQGPSVRVKQPWYCGLEYRSPEWGELYERHNREEPDTRDLLECIRYNYRLVNRVD